MRAILKVYSKKIIDVSVVNVKTKNKSSTT